jgi:ABC-type antimicrobial peptide transport system permease subunit
MFLHLLDIILTLFHLVVIGFNLFGWIWKPRLHLILVLLTAGCWFILGIWFGWGYCPITDWQWQTKEKLGEQDLPNSFIKYYADKISGQSIDPSLIDTLTAVCFFIATIITVYVNFFSNKSKST